jgi:hypothetical protein
MDVVSQVMVQLPVAAEPASDENSAPKTKNRGELFQLSWVCSSESSKQERTRELSVFLAPGSSTDTKLKGEFTVGEPSNPVFEFDCSKGALDPGKSQVLLVTCNVPAGAAVGSRLTGHVEIVTQYEVPRTFVIELAAEVAATTAPTNF